jgi:hypothetical protein
VLGHDGAGAANDHRNHRHPGVHGQHETALLERPDAAVCAARPFRKNQDRRAVPNDSGGLPEAPKRRFTVGAVDADVAGPLHPVSENGDFEQFGLGQPPELDGQASQQDRDVEIALVVGHVDVGTLGIQFFDAGDGDFRPTDPQQRVGPQPGKQMGAIASPAEK